MKKLLFLIVLAAALYVGGMNDRTPVIVCVICLLIVFLISLIFSRVMKRFISAELPHPTATVYKNTESPMTIRIHNKSRVPVSRTAITVSMKYKGSKTESKKKYRSPAPGGSCESEIYFTAPYCGIINAEIKRIRVYDYLYFFSCSKKQSSKNEIFVLPKPKKLRIILPEFGAYTANSITESSSDKSGEDHSEIRLVREYRDGDLTKHIHRNYSARTEKLWIKEYNKENDHIFDFTADTSGTVLTVELLDAMIEILFSAAGTIIENNAIIKLNWYDKNTKAIRSFFVRNTAQLSEAAALIYRSDLSCTKDEFSGAAAGLSEKGMTVNARLEWYFLDRHIFTFNPGNVENELLGNVFDLRR